MSENRSNIEILKKNPCMVIKRTLNKVCDYSNAASVVAGETLLITAIVKKDPKMAVTGAVSMGIGIFGLVGSSVTDIRHMEEIADDSDICHFEHKEEK